MLVPVLLDGDLVAEDQYPDLRAAGRVVAVAVQWSNYKEALTYPGFNFPRLLWNSIYYSGLTMIGTVASSALVGYGLARFRFPGVICSSRSRSRP